MADAVMIYPKTGLDVEKISIFAPLSVLCASALLDAEGYKVKIIDQRIDSKWEDTLRNELKSDPKFIGISSMTGMQIHFGLQAAKIVKETGVPTVWGGQHPSLVPVQTLQSDYVDFIVKWEGEETLLELIKNFGREPGHKSFSEIKGLGYKENGSPIINADRPFLDVNKLPMNPYHLIDVPTYIKLNNGTFSFLSSRGCPFGCTFCSVPLSSKRIWRVQTVDRTMEEINAIFDKYHFKKLHFFDENFFVNKERVHALGDAINGRFLWEGQARLDSVGYIDYIRLSKQGLYMVQPGLESGNPRILKMIKKEVTVENIIKFNKILAEAGIVATYNFMAGFPTETREEIMDTVRMSLRLLGDNPKAEVSAFYIFAPYPGAELYDLSIQSGFVPPQSLEEWSQFHRHHLITPWILNNPDMKDLLENLSITSKFVDGRRLARYAEGDKSLSEILQLLGFLYRRRWEREDFKLSWDFKIIEALVKMKTSFATNKQSEKYIEIKNASG